MIGCLYSHSAASVDASVGQLGLLCESRDEVVEFSGPRSTPRRQEKLARATVSRLVCARPPCQGRWRVSRSVFGSKGLRRSPTDLGVATTVSAQVQGFLTRACPLTGGDTDGAVT